jgi:hypothetical protein
VGGYTPMKMEQTEYSEMLAFKLQTPGNNPEGSTRLLISVIKTNQFMLCGAEVAVCSQINTK